MMKKLLFVFALLSFSVSAHAETAYLSALPDIPLMPQMKAMPETAVVFDKAEGRIVEESVKAPNIPVSAIDNFYAETLPALGWTRLSPQRFSRNGEQLIVNLEKLQSEGLVKFAVSPSGP